LGRPLTTSVEGWGSNAQSDQVKDSKNWHLLLPWLAFII